MASSCFTNACRLLARGEFDFDTDSIKVMLVSAVPSEADLDAWDFRNDVTTEITGTGYTAGGIIQPYTLSAVDTTNNRQGIVWSNILNGWTNSTFSAVGAIIYDNNGSAATDGLIQFIDFNGTVSCTAGNFSITYTTPFYINRG